MAKEIARIAKLQFNAGQAKPGPELAGLGIVMPQFTKEFNDATKDRGSEPVPVAITIYKDKSFDFKLFTAPASYMLKKAAKIEKGAGNSKTEIAGTITKAQLEEIAKYKLEDLNTNNVEAAMKIILGTAKNMGIKVDGIDDLKAAQKEIEKAAKDLEVAKAAEEKLKEDAEHAKDAQNKFESTKGSDDETSNEENKDEK